MESLACELLGLLRVECPPEVWMTALDPPLREKASKRAGPLLVSGVEESPWFHPGPGGEASVLRIRGATAFQADIGSDAHRPDVR